MISKPDSELSFKDQFKVSPPLSNLTTKSPLHSIQELNGLTVSIRSEIKPSADHAGLSVHLRLFQTDSVLLQKVRSMLSSHQRISLPATDGIWVAMEVSSHGLGPISPTLVQLLIHVSHTAQPKEPYPNVLQHVLMVLNSQNTNVPRTQLFKLLMSNKFKLKSSRTDPWKLVSPYTKTS